VAQWYQSIDRELAEVAGTVIMAGHSVGGSVLMKWLSERSDERELAGAVLLAAPFWGGDGWRYDGYEELALPAGIATALPADLPIFLYHCRDDATVPFDHLSLFAHLLPQATARAIDRGGHQLDGDLAVVAQDIATLPWAG
jgi:predicted alpha/beta hydrolase family esterase